MATLLLIIIFLAFISLGLPDSILGAAWPAMQQDFGVSFEVAGYLSISIAIGTMISSFISGKMLSKFGTAKVTVFSTLLTAIALLGIHSSPSIIWLFICSIPLGLGAGAIDTGLNDYVAKHYRAHHMSWLHCFWGVGATIGPIIIAQAISGNGWRNGFLAISLIQFGLVCILFATLPLWNKVHQSDESEKVEEIVDSKNKDIHPLKIKGVKLSVLSFLVYCGAEMLVGLWGSSYLVGARDIPIATAAKWVSMYYLGITVGRFITGFITFKFSNKAIIRFGQLLSLIGAILFFMPFSSSITLLGLLLIGLGFAPIFPSMLTETPKLFGKEHSQTIMGYQISAAYGGATFIPVIMGNLASYTTIEILPISIIICILIMLWASMRLFGFAKGDGISD